MPPHLQSLSKIHEKEISFESIRWQKKLDDLGLWCRLPYPNYPNGCPSYGSKHCPPNTECIRKYLKDHDSLKLIYIIFDFKKYKELRRIEHPQWSEKQLGNSRHWQKALQKMLKDYILSKHPDIFYATGSGFEDKCSIEGGGVNVFKTLENNGFTIVRDTEKPPKKGEYIERNPKTQIILVSIIATNQSSLLSF